MLGKKSTPEEMVQREMFLVCFFFILLGLFNLCRELNRKLLPALEGGLTIYKHLASAA